MLQPEGYDEITVYGDGFERWDDTWWYVETEIKMPYPVDFQASENHQFRSNAFQIRAVYHCEKTFPMGRKRHEVNCTIDNVGIKAMALELNNKHVQSILEELDAKLSGAKLELQVSADGRVDNIGIEGVPTRNRRESQILEMLRSILARSIAGFHMRLRKINPLNRGQWVEYDTPLMRMPSFTSSMGASLLVHQLDVYQDQRVVQSVGRGTITTEDWGVNNFISDFNGVSIYETQNAIMTERVWSLVGTPSASSYVSVFDEPPGYANRGRLRMITPDEYHTVGRTEHVVMPEQNTPKKNPNGLPEWVSLE
jgi:hypothetical protein